MPGNFDQRIEAIVSKARLLTERYESAVSQRDAAVAEVHTLKERVLAQQKQIETLSAQVDYLRIASTIGSTKEDVDQARHFVSELVWEIDKCIKQLSN